MTERRVQGQPTRWLIVRDAGGLVVGQARDVDEAQALLPPGGTITEGVGTVCDPGGDPIAERWR